MYIKLEQKNELFNLKLYKSREFFFMCFCINGVADFSVDGVESCL